MLLQSPGACCEFTAVAGVRVCGGAAWDIDVAFTCSLIWTHDTSLTLFLTGSTNLEPTTASLQPHADIRASFSPTVPQLITVSDKTMMIFFSDRDSESSMAWTHLLPIFFFYPERLILFHSRLMWFSFNPFMVTVAPLLHCRWMFMSVYRTTKTTSQTKVKFYCKVNPLKAQSVRLSAT